MHVKDYLCILFSRNWYFWKQNGCHIIKLVLFLSLINDYPVILKKITKLILDTGCPPFWTVTYPSACFYISDATNGTQLLTYHQAQQQCAAMLVPPGINTPAHLLTIKDASIQVLRFDFKLYYAFRTVYDLHIY